jgi:AraC-like DNA-binding protein
MRQFHVLPDPVLAPFVERLWGWESASGAAIALPTLWPGTGAELYFHYRQAFHYQSGAGRTAACHTAHLLCLRRQALPLCPNDAVGFVAVRLRAGMLQRFTDIPGGELIDRVLSVEELWGRAGREVVQRLAECEAMPERLRLIHDFLLKCLRPESADVLVEQAVTALYRESASISISQLAVRLNIGPRQMERRMLALTGQTPVELRRLGRLQKTLRALLLAPEAELLDVALANGYYDQSHFSRDCRALLAAPPGQLLRAARAKTHFYNTPRPASAKMKASDPF